MISQLVILFFWHTFQQITEHNIAGNKCTILLHFGQLVRHFSFPSIILLRYLRKTFNVMNLDLLLYDCIFAVSLPAKFGYYNQQCLGQQLI